MTLSEWLAFGVALLLVGTLFVLSLPLMVREGVVRMRRLLARWGW